MSNRIPFDPVIDVPKKKIYLEKILRILYPETKEIVYQTGKANIKFDLKVVMNSGEEVKVELKRLSTSYYDLIVEITQYATTSREYMDMVKAGKSREEIVTYLLDNSKAWFTHTEADVILVLKPEFIVLADWKKTKEFVIENLLALDQRYSGKTTGSWNKIVPINNQTKEFITIHRNFQRYLDVIYASGYNRSGNIRTVNTNQSSSIVLRKTKAPQVSNSVQSFRERVTRYNKKNGLYRSVKYGY